MQPLLGPETAVVMAVNGVPWWYFYGLEGPWRDRRLESVDPDGRQWRGIGPERVHRLRRLSGGGGGRARRDPPCRRATASAWASRTAAGRERVQALSQAMIAAGFKAPVKPDIRTEIWVKLWGNVAFNPISALTGATMTQICEEPDALSWSRRMMDEAEAVAAKLGVDMPIDVERRIDGAAAVGEHKTSMLQDLERGRPTGDRCHRRRRGRGRAHGGRAHARHRCGLCAGPPEGRAARPLSLSRAALQPLMQD